MLNPSITPSDIAASTRGVAVRSVDDFERLPIEKRLVWMLLHDLTDRAGFKRLWESLPAEIKTEIKETWTEIIKVEVKQSIQSHLSIAKGLEQSAKGENKYIGSFAQYADIEVDDD